ncbi:type II toxin-antitoxin system Phd/YefM family antitoxin [Salana multivorans]
MAITMTVTQVRAGFSRMLNLVEAGEEVTITRYGKPVATVVPPIRSMNNAARRAIAVADEVGRGIEEARKRPASGRTRPSKAAEEPPALGARGGRGSRGTLLATSRH